MIMMKDIPDILHGLKKPPMLLRSSFSEHAE